MKDLLFTKRNCNIISINIQNMNTTQIRTKTTNFKNSKSNFDTLENVVKYKTDIANKMLAKVDRKVLENLGK